MARAGGRFALSVVAITLLSAHVAPAVDDNNRYLKLTPLGDRVRLAYTVFYGEIPGAQERPGLDANHDGTIDAGEARAFGDRLGAEVARGLELEVDDERIELAWATVDVGLGTPDVAAGAFSVDLVAYPCLAAPRGRHRVRVRDHFHLEHPGETEVRIEDSPDVTIERAHVGPASDPGHDFRFAGAGGPIEDDGLELVYVAGEHSPVANDGKCTGRSAGRGGSRTTFALVALVVGIALAAAAAFAVIVIRRRRSG